MGKFKYEELCEAGLNEGPLLLLAMPFLPKRPSEIPFDKVGCPKMFGSLGTRGLIFSLSI
jgi:hypothetical protein